MLLGNVLKQRIELVRADNNKRWNSHEAEKIVLFCNKICFKPAVVEDELRIRDFMGYLR